MFRVNWTVTLATWQSSAKLPSCQRLRKFSFLIDIMITDREHLHVGCLTMTIDVTITDREHMHVGCLTVTIDVMITDREHLHVGCLTMMIGLNPVEITRHWVRDSAVALTGRTRLPDNVETVFGSLMTSEELARYSLRTHTLSTRWLERLTLLY